MKKMPVRWEPVLAIVRAQTSQELHDYWQKISTLGVKSRQPER